MKRIQLVVLSLFLSICAVVINGIPLEDVSGNEKKTVRNCRGYEACAPVNESGLNVHIISHSHDDVGWLKTVDQYFYGWRNNIQKAGVNYIIGSVVDALVKHPDRRFIQVETAFFWQWWQQQSEEVKDTVRQLVDEGRFEIINGAWSMNDEAASHYQSIIDQFTWGLKIINDTVGECGRPRVGWQIDPFGHSNAMATMFTELGYEGVFFARLDYRDKWNRQMKRNMDFIWQGNSDFGSSTNLFTSIFYDFYTQPSTFCWDVLCNDEPMIDNEASPDYNVDKRVQQFADLVQHFSLGYKSNHVVVPMGGDFTYQAANMYFTNIDKLIAGFKRYRPDINIFYSTPSCYIKAVNEASKKNSTLYELKTDDFFPYASGTNTYWTGYYTSRPNSKHLERQGNNLLQVSKQLLTVEKLRKGKDYVEDLSELREVMGIMQHHDAITGTEKQHVADDYSRLLDRAIKHAEKDIGQIVVDLLGKEGQNPDSVKVNLTSCLLSNVTYCLESNQDVFTILVYNPSSWNTTHHVRLPVNDVNFMLKSLDGAEIDYDITDVIANFTYQSDIIPSKYDLVFAAKDVPPMGLQYYHVEKTTADKVKPKEKDIKVENHLYYGSASTGFNITSNGHLESVTINGITMDVNQTFLFYTAAAGNNFEEKDRSSGAYIFRPNITEAIHFTNPVENILVKEFRGSVVDEVHQQFGEFIKQIIRVYKDDNLIEFDWVVGPLKIDNTNNGIEVITRFETNLQSNGTFYTDSNGREMVKRVRGYRATFNYTDEEPVSGNYYPITTMISLRDGEREFSVLTDRAEGGSSLKDGQLEIMVHRRLLRDDGFGVGEALNEKQYYMGLVTRGRHFLYFGDGTKQRQLVQQKLLQPWVFVGNATGLSFDGFQQNLNFKFGAMKEPLDSRVQVLTMEPWSGNSVLLRLENIMEKRIDNSSVTVDLNNLFTDVQVVSFEEMTLGANQYAADIQRMTWNTTTTTNSDFTFQKAENTTITLQPMQIRTFVVNLQYVRHT